MKILFMKRYNCIYYIFIISILAGSCKEKDGIYPDPYAGGKETLGISFSAQPPVPEQAVAGDDVTYKVQGLSGYNENDLRVYLHGEKADVVSLTDSTLTLKVPEWASSGGVSLYLEGQVFFGPALTIEGKVNIDKTFKAGNGVNGLINGIIETSSTNLLMVGFFSDYNLNAVNQPINNIVMTDINGEYLPTLLSGTGANGLLSGIAPLSDGKYIVAGSFSRFNGHTGANSITRLNKNGSLDTMIVTVVNTTPEDPSKGVDTVPAFNGGVVGSIVDVFTHNDNIIAVGNFGFYESYFYETSTYDTKIIDGTPINQLLKMDENGKLDSTFNYDKTANKPYPGGNGAISDALMLEDGSIIAVGGFTKFDNLNAGRIVKLGLDGLPITTFNSGGTGADENINTVYYNATTQKIMITGLFQHYNGKEYNGIAMLNEDGSLDLSFKPGKFEGGGVNFAAQLSNGLIIVSGSFKKYNGVTRNGFMILNPDGSLAEGYNNMGDFQGQIEDIYETKSALGRPAVILAGYIRKFDGKQVGSIVRLEFQP